MKSFLLGAACLFSPALLGQSTPPAPDSPPVYESQSTDSQSTDSQSTVTLFPHPDSWPLYIAGQANIVFQAHPGFHSPYESTNSLLSRGEYKVSLVGTLYTGLELIRNPRWETEFLFDLESSGGRGVSEALGLAGFTNLDVVRNPSLGSVPYVARVQIHATFGLTDTLVEQTRSPFALATRVPARRFEFRFGRMSMPDLFDTNSVGTDSHLQFLNWTVDNNGAWDYAADTRGYTYASTLEFDTGDWSARYALALMPTIANGVDLDWNIRRARGENYEVDWNRGPAQHWFTRKKGAIRTIAFVNHANMGVYREANRKALETGTTPDIQDHAPKTTAKYGFGLNVEQELGHGIRGYSRFGWNEGQHESFAYTEVDQTFSGGVDISGSHWGKANDKVGLALVSNAIKRDHQEYLALGGKGFILGDGRLNYAREDILETYYNAHIWRGLFSAFDIQLVDHPGYNKDRGPVAMFTVRSHVDF